MNYGYGDFGNLNKNYAKGRQDFPSEVIDWIFTFLNNNSIILDLGCGTGISTRQLERKGGTIIGCDKDKLMIEEARKINDDIEYFIAPAEDLPLESEKFDAVTAFSAFHWFMNEKAISEIKKVLKLKGLFFVINKNDTGDFKKGYYQIVKSFIDHDLPEAKKDYNPADFLSKNGFQSIQAKDFPYSEYFSQEEAVSYLQSVSIWNLVSDKLKSKALKILEDYLRKQMSSDGKIEREINIKVVVGQK